MSGLAGDGIGIPVTLFGFAVVIYVLLAISLRAGNG